MINIYANKSYSNAPKVTSEKSKPIKESLIDYLEAVISYSKDETEIEQLKDILLEVRSALDEGFELKELTITNNGGITWLDGFKPIYKMREFKEGIPGNNDTYLYREWAIARSTNRKDITGKWIWETPNSQYFCLDRTPASGDNESSLVVRKPKLI